MTETNVGTGTTRRKAFQWAGFFAAGVMGAVLGNTAFSVARADFGGGPGFGRHGFFRGHGGDPEKAREHAQMAVDVAFRLVSATDDQRGQARAIIARHIQDAGALHARHGMNRQAGLDALTAPTVDREKLEAVRKAQIQLAEDASHKLTDAVAELAEVLTPEQRGELAQMAARFHR